MMPRPPVETIPVLYIAGSGHSGSTLLSLLLNASPAVFAIGEMRAPRFPEDRPQDRLCSCGSTLRTCPHWIQVGARLLNSGEPFDPSTWDFRYRIVQHEFLNRVLTGNLRSIVAETLRDQMLDALPWASRQFRDFTLRQYLFCEACLLVTGKRVFADASKEPMRIPMYSRMKMFELRVVHLVRDPRGYANSRMRDAKLSARRATHEWLRTNLAVERQLRRLAEGTWTRLTYEELCTNVPHALRKVTALIGAEEVDPSRLQRRDHAHVMGNKMRLRGLDLATVRLDERWRDDLNRADLKVVQDECQHVADRYGYRIDL